MNSEGSSLHIRASWGLWKREVIRFLRQRNRIIGALGTPVIFWLLIGSGVGSSFQDPNSAENPDYLQFFFVGTIAMIILFTAIFSTISIIEDRKEGFLQGVLVSPAPRSSIVLGKVLGGTTLAFGQAVLFTILAPTVGLSLPFNPISQLFYFLLIVLILSIGLTCLGYLVAWKMDSTHGFHAIMNLFLLPLWLLSGSLFTVDGAHGWIAWVMKVNPLTYGVETLRYTLTPGYTGSAQLPEFCACLIISCAATAIVFFLSVWITQKET